VRALVTGDRGFVGGYLTERLQADGHEVIGFDLPDRDITNPHHIFDRIYEEEPDQIFHLAAQTCVPASFEAPDESLEVNVAGTLNLLQALRAVAFKGPILISGTSEEYGYEHNTAFITEDSACRPVTPYGVGKLAATGLGQTYARRYGLRVISTRANNHIGPGQEGGVVAEWARQVVEIEQGKREKLTHGDLNVRRSFLDVRDVVEAYICAIRLKSGVYNVSTTSSVSLDQILNWLVGMASCPIVTESDPKLTRPTEVKRFVPMSSGHFMSITSWYPSRAIRTTLEDVLNWWRKNLDPELS
jgi:GDP-4-dehydro-6-deoxy-D-mannose reductase